MAQMEALMDTFLNGLAQELEGSLVEPAHAEYDAARALWNGAIDRRPAALARVGGARDVAAVLRHAAAAGRTVCVRGGGHSAPGHSCIDDALMIDLSALRTVTVDSERETARVGGGALWSDVDKATAAHGLATTGGLVSHTGVGGLTLGGGIGWLMRKHGLAIDNLVGAEVVLADGRVVNASADENADLFWALRGGGGNFGVVTEFRFRLHPVRNVLAGMVLHPVARAGELLRFFRELTEGAPEELTALFAFMLAPPAPFVPPAMHGAPLAAIVVCWCGDPVRGAEVLAPVRAFGPPAIDLIGEMPYVALQSMLDPGAPRGMRYYMKGAFYDALSDGAIDALVGAAAQPSSLLSAVHLHHLGGAVARVDSSATPYGHRGAKYALNIIAGWPEGGGESHIGWARGVYDAAASFSNGAGYVNFLGDEGEARIASAYGQANFARLKELKRTYDPKNVFRYNQNIPTTA
jgi:FAD/FMN-containing dehydrogenase